MTDEILKTEKLTRIYGKNTGIKNLDLSVKKGEVYGFLGPNGAGKSTTINLLLNLARPTSGTIKIFGLDARKNGKEARSRIGFIPGDPGYYENMTGYEYLKYFSGLRGKPYNREFVNILAERFGSANLSRRIKSCSTGMRQILLIIQAFMSSPDLYILDEPTNNLDPLMREQFYQIVLEEIKKGKTVFLSSHILGEVERLCNRFCIINRGETVVCDSVENLRRSLSYTVEATFSEIINPESLKFPEVNNIEKSDGRYIIKINGNISNFLEKISKMPLASFECRTMSLEEIFLDSAGFS